MPGSALLPCPFCGCGKGDNTIDRWLAPMAHLMDRGYAVNCPCGASVGGWATKEAAELAWNTRKPNDQAERQPADES